MQSCGVDGRAGREPVPEHAAAGSQIEEPVLEYGKALVRFKPRVRHKATFTVGDSLNYGDELQGSKLKKADAKSIPVDRLTQHEFKVMARGHSDPADDLRDVQISIHYVEVQFHGGLPISDIRDILFVEEPDAELRALLQQAGIPWRVEQGNP